MGNCIFVSQSPPKEKIRVVVSGSGGEETFKPFSKVKKITAGPYKGYRLLVNQAPPKAKLKPGAEYFLVPLSECPPSPPFSCIDGGDEGGDSGGGRTVKILVTREQLGFLMRNVGFQSQNVAIRSCWGREGRRKWRPSLATIPE